jgi:lipopolysaccharide biosynthesis glycosyltransferase
MVDQALKSIKSLRKRSRVPVIVVNTPPNITQDQEKLFKKLDAEVFFKPTETDPVKIGHRTGLYLEKLTVLGLYDRENVIFLDCDTLVMKDPRKLLKGGFDFSARIAPANLNTDWRIYSKIFQNHGIKPLPMFNTGVMVIKNGFIQELARWSISFSANKYPRYNPQNLIDQLAVTLAVSMLDLEVNYMTTDQHSFRWLHETKRTVVYHGSSKYKKREFLRSLRGVLRYVS